MNAGFQGEDLVRIVAIAGRESGYNPTVKRTPRSDWGLWQINAVNFKPLMTAGIISDPEQLMDPATNARAAFWLYQQSGLQPWSKWAQDANGEWYAAGDWNFNVDINAARTAVQNVAANPQAYGAGPQAGQASTDSGAAVEIPPDAQIIATNGFSPFGNSYVFAVFDFGGVKLAYNVMVGTSDWKKFNVQTVDRATWDSMGVVFAGDVQELAGVKETWGTTGAFFKSLLDTVLGPYNPARNDPDVMRVLAEYAARPDMSEQELQGRLEATSWWRTHTQAQLEWNGLSQAEQQQRIAETGAQVADVWFRTVGERINPTDSRITHYIQQIASGALGWGAFQLIVQDIAGDNPESPYSRDTRTEQEAQRQRPIDIENTAKNIRDTLGRWGVHWTDAYVRQWAKQIVEKVKSDDDLMTAIKNQAATLFPWKDPEMETIQAAQPWIQVYERTMEGPGSLDQKDIARALSAGQPVWEFEQALKRNPAWAGTKNGQDQLTSMVAEIGKRMGYV